jgi:hypothetical protein
MSVTYQLARLTPRGSETKPEDNAVETAFELLQEQFSGDARLAGGLLKVVAELAFLGEINALCFLLFAQLEAIAYNFGLAVLAMLAGCKVALFDGTLVAEALRAFQKKLDAFAAAKTTDGIGIACQIIFSL